MYLGSNRMLFLELMQADRHIRALSFSRQHLKRSPHCLPEKAPVLLLGSLYHAVLSTSNSPLTLQDRPEVKRVHFGYHVHACNPSTKLEAQG